MVLGRYLRIVSIDAKLPNRRSSWGVTVRSDIEIYLDILELIHATADSEGVKILFRSLCGHWNSSELLVNAQFPHSLIAVWQVQTIEGNLPLKKQRSNRQH